MEIPCDPHALRTAAQRSRPIVMAASFMRGEYIGPTPNPWTWARSWSRSEPVRGRGCPQGEEHHHQRRQRHHARLAAQDPSDDLLLLRLFQLADSHGVWETTLVEDRLR